MLVAVLALPLLVPGYAVGTGLATWLIRLGVPGGVPGIIVAHLPFVLAYEILVLAPAFDRRVRGSSRRPPSSSAPASRTGSGSLPSRPSPAPSPVPCSSASRCRSPSTARRSWSGPARRRSRCCSCRSRSPTHRSRRPSRCSPPRRRWSRSRSQGEVEGYPRLFDEHHCHSDAIAADGRSRASYESGRLRLRRRCASTSDTIRIAAPAATLARNSGEVGSVTLDPTVATAVVPGRIPSTVAAT